MFLALFGLALAETPVNPDFEAVGGWSLLDGSLNGEARIVQQGESWSTATNTTSLIFPSPVRALMVRSGGVPLVSFGIAQSEPFLLTESLLTVDSRAESAEATATVRVRRGDLAVSAFALPITTSFVATQGSVASFCGERVRLEFEVGTQSTGQMPFVLVDDVRLQQTCAIYLDGDGDGHCPRGVDLSVPPDGRCDGPDEAFGPELDGGDCDDTDASISPDGIDIPDDGIDQDCSGADVSPNCFEDLDGDGFGTVPIEGNADCSGPAEASVGEDCLDTDDQVNPEALERCNGLDDDCDGAADPGPSLLVFPDLDGDGYGTGPGRDVCAAVPAGYATEGGDCNDAQLSIHPGAFESPANGVDQDCDGAEACYVDLDGDGFGTPALVSGDLACSGVGVTGQAGDCDDGASGVNPAGIEVCDGVDNNCVDGIDEGFGATITYADEDGDGYGDGARAHSGCDTPPAGNVLEAGDCDDTDASRHPGADEVRADGIDQDCDGREACYRDADGDGFGVPALVFDPDLTCAGFATNPDDCNDTNAAISPEQVEVPDNGIDDDCDGVSALTQGPTYVLGGSTCATSPGVTWFAWLGVLAMFRRSRG